MIAAGDGRNDSVARGVSFTGRHSREVGNPDPASQVPWIRGAQRDRSVDENGNQMSVYGRIGSRPLNLAEREPSIERTSGSTR